MLNVTADLESVPGTGNQFVGVDVRTAPGVDVRIAANVDDAAAAVEAGTRQTGTFAQMAMRGLGRSARDYTFSRQLPRQPC